MIQRVSQLFGGCIFMWFEAGVSPSLLIFTNSQTMLKAISSGVTAPIEMPIGEWTLLSVSCETPLSCRCL